MGITFDHQISYQTYASDTFWREAETRGTAAAKAEKLALLITTLCCHQVCVNESNKNANTGDRDTEAAATAEIDTNVAADDEASESLEISVDDM